MLAQGETVPGHGAFHHLDRPELYRLSSGVSRPVQARNTACPGVADRGETCRLWGCFAPEKHPFSGCFGHPRSSFIRACCGGGGRIPFRCAIMSFIVASVADVR
jgi:hypothetical protein